MTLGEGKGESLGCQGRRAHGWPPKRGAGSHEPKPASLQAAWLQGTRRQSGGRHKGLVCLVCVKERARPRGSSQQVEEPVVTDSDGKGQSPPYDPRPPRFPPCHSPLDTRQPSRSLQPSTAEKGMLPGREAPGAAPVAAVCWCCDLKLLRCQARSASPTNSHQNSKHLLRGREDGTG